MEEYYNSFLKLLESEDRYECVKFVKKLLDEKKVGIVELYQDIIKPLMENITCKVNEKNICIWQEHIRSGIVRTVIESCYTYVIDESKVKIDQKKGKVVVLCPQEEYHDIGARMITDLFSISGYESIFVGSNTPKSDFLAALEYIKPEYVAISVTNYYNLVAAKNYIDGIKEKLRSNIQILVGGTAFKSDENLYKTIGADKYIDTFDDINKMGGI